MQQASLVVTALVALIHVYILVLEMFWWDTPRGRRAFGLTPEFATQSKVLAANQGLYNGFLAAGLAWGLWLGADGVAVRTFFLGCVLVAGVYGAATANRRILYIQAVPAALALALMWLAPRALGAQTPPQALPRLAARHDTLDIRYAGQSIGTGIMEWRYVNGEHLQVYIWRSADGSSVTDSLFAHAETLRPRREVRVTADTVITVVFERDTIWVLSQPGGGLRRSPTQGADYYSSASLEALAAAMPFEVGATRWVNAYYAPPSPRGAQWVMLKVEARDTVAGRAAWRVTAGTSGGGTVYWVDAATRTVLQSDLREGEALITFRRQGR